MELIILTDLYDIHINAHYETELNMNGYINQQKLITNQVCFYLN